MEKVRPCCVTAVDLTAGKITVVPITHAKPQAARARWAIAIDSAVAKAAGLDANQNYVICDEGIRMRWPTKRALSTCPTS